MAVGLMAFAAGHEALVQQGKASQGYVRGVVTDETGEPVPGATVVNLSTNTGSMTDIQGGFVIKVSGKTTLEASCLGYDPARLEVDPSSNDVRFVLHSVSETLDELVVVGYGTMRRSLVTSAISKVGMDETKMRQVTNPAELLNGRVAGVASMTGSGNVGSGERMQIRGISSLNAGNEPLYVIDGVPIYNRNANLTNQGEDMSSLSILNLNDIESIEILKDAASAAIYGSRATNGVVIITTKSGRGGASDLKLNVTTGIAAFPNIHKIRMADSNLYVEVYNEGIDNYNKQYGYQLGDSGYKTHIYNPFMGMEDYDWMKAITRIGQSYGVDASLSGGNKTTNYYIGASYNYKEGVIKTNDLNKVNFNAKVSHSFTDWLEAGASTSANYMKNHQIPGANNGANIIGRALLQRPFDRPYKPDGSYYVGGTDELTYHNALQILNEQKSFMENMRFIGNYYFNLKFLEGKLQFKNSLNTDIATYYDYTNYNENHPYGEGVGLIVDRHETGINLSLESVLSYNDAFPDKELTLNAMLGHSFMYTKSYSLGVYANGYPSPSFDVVGIASTIEQFNGGLSAFAMESYFGRLSTSWKGRYLLTATLRTDGSSKFAKAVRWGWFPSVSLGWNITKEPFMEDLSGTDLKFRLSYGKTGNQEGIGRYAYQAKFSGGYNYGSQSGIAVNDFGNDDLTWEKADQFDIGMDMGFFKDRLTIILDGYLKNTTDLLYSMPIHGTTGRTSVLANIGSMRNTGVELTVGASLDFGQIHWDSNFNISHNSNVLTSLLGDEPVLIGSNRILQVGKEVGTFYLFRHDGIFQYDAEVPEAQYDQGRRAGDIRWYDRNGDGVITDDDRFEEYSSNPKFFGGWNNTLSWKGLSLSVFFTYMYGNYTYFGQGANLSRGSRTAGVCYDFVINRWTGPGTTNVWPRSMNGDNNNARNSDFFLFDGSFIRLRSLTLAYNFPKKVLSRLRLKGLRAFVQGDNLLLLTRYPGYDPEVSSNMDPRFFGVDNLNVPQPRMVNAGANFTF